MPSRTGPAGPTLTESLRTFLRIPPRPPGPQRPFYARMLDLQHVQPNGWQRALFGEGSIAVAIVLVLADVASLWLLIVLPLSVAVVVKTHDVITGLLAKPGGSPTEGASP